MPTVEVRVSGSIAHVTLDRPPVNVVDLAMAAELAEALEALAPRHDLCVVALEGRGRAFCAGVDVRDHLPDRGADMLHTFHRACLALAAIEAPTVAVVHGAALGGGCELTLMCDLVWAAEAASFGQPEIRLGVFPPLAAVALPRMIPPGVAAELVLTGRTLTALEAERLGLVTRVTRDDELAGSVEQLLAGFAASSAESLRLTKRALSLSRVRPTAAEVLEAERFYVDHLMHTADAVEGLTAFLEKRKPAWSAPATR